MKKRMKRVSLILCCVWCFSSIITVNAQNESAEEAISTRTTCYIDNDESNNEEWGNAQNGLWTYVTGTNHFRLDARRSYITQENFYTWTFGTTGSYISNPSLYVYLNSAEFVDPTAQYTLWAYNTGSITPTSYLIGTLDQNIAPAGWGYVGSAGYTPAKKVSHVVLRIVHNWPEAAGFTGADGVMVR